MKHLVYRLTDGAVFIANFYQLKGPRLICNYFVHFFDYFCSSLLNKIYGIKNFRTDKEKKKLRLTFILIHVVSIFAIVKWLETKKKKLAKTAVCLSTAFQNCIILNILQILLFFLNIVTSNIVSANQFRQ